jgi:hypothetical protein
MLSLKTARALKEAGLQWEPKVGDWFAYVDGGEELREQWEIASTNIYVISGEHKLMDELGGRMVFFGGGLCARDGGNIMNETCCGCMNATGFSPGIRTYSVASWEKKLWILRLDQLLAEIEARGYYYILRNDQRSGHPCALTICHKAAAEGMKFMEPTHEETAAAALLWILKEARSDG